MRLQAHLILFPWQMSQVYSSDPASAGPAPDGPVAADPSVFLVVLLRVASASSSSVLVVGDVFEAARESESMAAGATLRTGGHGGGGVTRPPLKKFVALVLSQNRTLKSRNCS